VSQHEVLQHEVLQHACKATGANNNATSQALSRFL